MKTPDLDPSTPESQEIKEDRYWHTTYAEPIAREDLTNWSEHDLGRIIYIGKMTQAEWQQLLDNCQRDGDGEPVLFGPKIDRAGNPVE